MNTRAKWKIADKVYGFAIIGAVLWALICAGPRIYEPYYMRADPHDSRTLFYYERGWFGGKTETKLVPKYHEEMQAWLWHAKGKDGKYYPFFREAPDYPED